MFKFAVPLRVLDGDARTVLQTLPSESVHCVVTSPPYYGLRDYGVAGQLGLEATPAEYIASMVAVFREVRRVLRKDGTLWLNIGDSYNNRAVSRPSSHQAGLGFHNESIDTSWRDHAANGRAHMSITSGGLKEKDLLGIPWMLAFALREDGWYLRSDIIWSKPNPMPESVSDRPTKAHEYLFLLTRSSRYYYDADAIREPASYADHNSRYGVSEIIKENAARGDFGAGRFVPSNAAGRNKRSVWEIATEPFPEAHFATYPTALVEPCIKAGTSEKGCCPECGASWARVTERAVNPRPHSLTPKQQGMLEQGKVTYQVHGPGWRKQEQPSVTTTGWRATCAHADLAPIPCTVLDLFCGAGTTLLVADRLDREAIGIELNPTYAEMARRRLVADAPLFVQIAV